MASQFLGIEIGGTKLQLGVGPGDGETITELVRRDVDLSRGAQGIQAQILEAGRELVQRHKIVRIGYGFGGPVFGARGIVQKSNQVAGWDQFPLVQWTEQQLGVPTRLGNDCDVAALAEATYGAGKQARSVFYVTVGTGIGGGLVLDRRIHGTDRPACAEIGHLRPGPPSMTSAQTVESIAAGPGIALRVQRRLKEHLEFGLQDADASALIEACQGHLESLTTKQLAAAAVQGNRIARHAYLEATEVLGWGIAQMITLLAPEQIVVGGGVSLVGDAVFFDPLRDAVARFVFPPLVGSYQLSPAALGESVVVHGALALAAAP
jgi:glucokinase